jgi:hypothetical protein
MCDSKILGQFCKPFLLMVLSFAGIAITHAQTLVTVKIDSIVGYGEHEAFARGTAVKLEELLNSPQFKAAVVAEKYTWNKNLEPIDIYNIIMRAHETDGPGGVDSVIDLRLRTITFEHDGQKWMTNCEPGSRSGTIGIDGGNSGIAAICPQWLKIWEDKKDTASLAAHFMHEYIHVLGFSHQKWGSKRQHKTVPYKIQGIIEQLMKSEGSGSDNSLLSIPQMLHRCCVDAAYCRSPL